jgi:hypothetical protein
MKCVESNSGPNMKYVCRQTFSIINSSQNSWMWIEQKIKLINGNLYTWTTFCEQKSALLYTLNAFLSNNSLFILFLTKLVQLYYSQTTVLT